MEGVEGSQNRELLREALFGGEGLKSQQKTAEEKGHRKNLSREEQELRKALGKE